jgi:type I restriction enzyme S subunit
MVRLGDHLNVIRGASPRPKGDPRYFGGDIPWISISDLTREPGKYLSRTREFVTRAGADKSRLLPAGTLILSNSGTVCVPKILRVDGCIHDGFVAFPELPDSFDKNYLYWFFEYVRPSIIEANRQGITQVNLNTGIVREIRLPLTSIERQREIVAELEKQFSRLDEAVANLQRVKANLKRYKASVLKAAVEGRLVETESTLARREGRTYETGEQLLQRILEARRTKWTGRGKYKIPVAPLKDGLPSLPEGWTWANADQLTHLITSGSRGWGDFYSDTGILFIRAQDIKTDALNLPDAARVDVPVDAEGTRSSVSEGDILVTITGANVTKSALVPALGELAFVSQHVALMKLAMPEIATFVFNWIISPANGRKTLESWAYGAGKPGLSLEQVRALPIALPPLAEQARIVAEVDRHLSIIREVETEVDTNLKRAQALRQATLAKAFGIQSAQPEH